jgi:hypothetical protein
MRRFVLILLFLALIVSLNRDGIWALLQLSNEPLTKAEVEEIIDRYLSAQSRWNRCDCHAPTVECEEICAQSDQVGECLTMTIQIEMDIRRAMEVDSNPWDIAKLISEHPDPFSKMYVLVYPGKKLQLLQPTQAQQVN